MLKILSRKGQSAVEYSVLVIIVIGALIGMQNYFKRGFQGRMRASVDSVGEQYDPMQSSADITHTLSGTTVTNIAVQRLANGTQTLRTDTSILTESKQGFTQVDAY